MRLMMTTQLRSTSNDSQVMPRCVGRKTGPLDILFVGESGGMSECREGRAFVGQTGELMDDIVEFEFPGRTVMYDNVCRCKLGNEKPEMDHLSECVHFVRGVIHKRKPKVTVLMGEYALRAFGEKGKPTTLCGEEIQPGILASVHPAYILRSPHEEIYLRIMTRQVHTMLSPTKYKVRKIEGVPQLRDLFDQLGDASCAFDIETTSLNPRMGIVLTAALTYSNAAGWPTSVWWPVHHESGWGTADANKVLSLMSRWWGKGLRIIHNAKFELAWAWHHWSKKKVKFECTLIRQGQVDENHSVGLNWIAKTLGYPAYWRGLPKPDSYASADLGELGYYNAMDTRVTWHAWKDQEDHLQPCQLKLLKKVMYPLIPAIMEMERSGIKLDMRRVRSLTTSLQRECQRIQYDLDMKFGAINVRSTADVKRVLFEELKLPDPGIRTHTGGLSVNKEALEKLVGRSKWAKMIARLRHIEDKISSVLVPFVEKNEKGFIHTTLKIGTVKTGRLASANPNMQNLDRDGQERECLVSRFVRGSLVQGDSRHHELRILAACSKDPALILAIKTGDPHQALADKTGETRQNAKSTNFALASGMSIRGLAERLGCSETAAKQHWERWFATYPVIRSYHTALIREMKRTGQIELWTGRIRHLPWGTSSEDTLVRDAIRKAKNTPIQAGGADVVSEWTSRVYRRLRRERLRSLMVLQVHDSLVVDTPPGEVQRVKNCLREEMEAIDIGIPLGVDLTVARCLVK